MADPVALPEPETSRAPIWIALAIGALLSLPWWPYGLFIALPLALVAGISIAMLSRSNAAVRALRAGNAALALRVSELEHDVAGLKVQARTARAQPDAAGASPVPDPVVETTAALSPPPPAAPEPTGTSVADSDSLPSRLDEAVSIAMQSAPQAEVPAPAPHVVPEQAPPRGPSLFERGIAAARAWLLGGNTVARVGVLVLFVGVAFLLRYVAERTQVPIELRLVGVALLALVFLGLGWRMRERRAGFAVTLQGAAIGILYLTAFAALRLYAVLPPLVAFGFMALLAVVSGFLAVLQNARALAALGAAGGFLAPILVSTGEGRVALLFSYYLLLNCGVLGLAWFRAWRELNWIGFAATFGVSGIWAVRRYAPEDFLVGQTFLVLFWLLFLAVSLLYALRQRERTRGLFDTTLVFTLPLAAFGIQTRFTEGLALALASTVAAAVYLGVSSWLLRRRDTAFQLLTEACFALGVGFLTLAIPLAASAQWTAAAWALEGTALVWVGYRQGRILPLAAGGLLHAFGALALVRALAAGDISIAPAWSGFTVNLAVFAVAAFLCAGFVARTRLPAIQAALLQIAWGARAIGWAWVVALVWQPLAFPWYVFAWCVMAVALIAFDRGRVQAQLVSPEWVAGIAIIVIAAVAGETRFPQDGAQVLHLLLRLSVSAAAVTAALLALRGTDPIRRGAAAALLTLGVLAWLVAVLGETIARVDAELAVAQIGLALVAVTAVGLGWLGAQFRWQWPQRLAWTFFAVHVVFAGYVVVQAIFGATLPSRYYGWIIWPLAWVLYYWRLGAEDGAPVRIPAPELFHVAGLWLLATMLGAECALQLDRVAGDGWFHAAWGAVLAGSLWLVATSAHRWPVRLAPAAYARFGAPGLAVLCLLWLCFANVHSGGDPAPIPALPLLNPMDLVSVATLGALVVWHLNDSDPERGRIVRAAIAAAAFFVVNIIALRAVHFAADVGWSAAELGRSLIVQAVLSLLWTASAMALMLFAHRRRSRPVWIAGACLLAAVVGKLFLVDLSGQGTIERIVSFVGVGLLILLIGYLAPVPPAAAAARTTEAS